MNVLRVEIQTFAHATEDLDTLVSCLGAVLKDFEYSIERTHGHFKNPIDLITAKYTGKRAAATFEAIARGMSATDKEMILSKIEDRFDDKLYIRLDKMRTCSGEIALGDGVQVAITVTSYPFDRDKIIKELKDIFQK